MRRYCAALFPLWVGVSLLILCSPGYADDSPPIKISPSEVGVGINFGGADVLIAGTAPPNAQVVVRVATEPATVKLSKKGRIMGIFWMTTERAVVQNMPTFYALYGSQPLESLLGREEQIRIGADTDCTSIMNQARVTGDSGVRADLSPQEAQDYVASLRDIYIKNGRYVLCVSCHQARSGADSVPSSAEGMSRAGVRLAQGNWDLRLRLPADTPLGDYDVTAFYVQDGKVVGSQSSKLTVKKTGLVEILGTMATQNAPAYGAVSLLVVVLCGLGIGFVFPRGRH